MQNSRKHHLVGAGTGLLLMLAAACGGDDTNSTDQGVGSGGTSAGTKASGGRSGTTASSSGGTRAPSGGSSSTSTTPTSTTAGKGGSAAPSGGAGRVAGDEDAGVSPVAGGPKGGAGGTSAGSSAAGSGGHAGAASAAGSGGSAQGATFTQVYALFTTNCALAGCHGTGRAGDNLSMVDKDTAYKNLVEAASVSCSGAKRVVAGDTDKSELVHTLQHTMLAGCARTPKMPDNKPMLAQSDIDLVVSWVKAGAKND